MYKEIYKVFIWGLPDHDGKYQSVSEYIGTAWFEASPMNMPGNLVLSWVDGEITYSVYVYYKLILSCWERRQDSVWITGTSIRSRRKNGKGVAEATWGSAETDPGI